MTAIDELRLLADRKHKECAELAARLKVLDAEINALESACEQISVLHASKPAT